VELIVKENVTMRPRKTRRSVETKGGSVWEGGRGTFRGFLRLMGEKREERPESRGNSGGNLLVQKREKKAVRGGQDRVIFRLRDEKKKQSGGAKRNTKKQYQVLFGGGPVQVKEKSNLGLVQRLIGGGRGGGGFDRTMGGNCNQVEKESWR